MVVIVVVVVVIVVVLVVVVVIIVVVVAAVVVVVKVINNNNYTLLTISTVYTFIHEPDDSLSMDCLIISTAMDPSAAWSQWHCLVDCRSLQTIFRVMLESSTTSTLSACDIYTVLLAPSYEHDTSSSSSGSSHISSSK